MEGNPSKLVTLVNRLVYDMAQAAYGRGEELPQLGLRSQQACSVVAKFLKWLVLRPQIMCLWNDRILGNLVEMCQEVDVLWTHTAAFDMVLDKTGTFWLKAEKEKNTAYLRDSF